MNFKKKELPKQFQSVKITLTSRNSLLIEKIFHNILNNIKDKKIMNRGLTKIPTRTLTVTTRKSPCGEGTNTWDHFENKIYKRIVCLSYQDKIAAYIANINIESGIEVDVKVI
ncbi:40S ribosomal protein S20 (nucleomorph) [Cryptomonas paramecium]|uniref:40S ribosomal protein S20 n=1 Tax=Cryptomonas paramaecium TaxID=2898 RepID=F2HHS3_9CRYP|nr:40S ribosomal protein S20 [Cryptomonas paramecium]AEA38869.1 40S ribosomal protein S20 [Cryptomonas paramecium]|mmetsp:Transcript_36629/g.96498  ORF Transcript_36629/g.96498 Transcript_36629/m.96498 type:complete len:113 (+) Transcript_36629:5379-5717(+)